MRSLWTLYENFISDRLRSWPDCRTRWKNFIEPALGDRRPDDIRRADVYALLDSMVGYAPATKQRCLALLRRFYSWLQEMELYHGSNPCSRVSIYVDNVRTRVLTLDERERLLEGLRGAPLRLRLAVLALLWTGKRRGEIRSLVWSDVDLDRGLLTLRPTNTKSKRTQVIPLNSKALDVFQEAAANRISNYCFPAPSGVYYSELNKHWERFRASIGLDGLFLHDLRRDFISRMAKAGIAPQVIMKLSGHSTLGMVMRYTQLAPEDVRDASEAICRNL